MPIKAAVLLSIAVCAIAILPRNRPIPSVKLYAGMSQAEAEVFERACKDCHSNDTAWPWYSKIPPISLGVAADVHKGRNTWNVSDWETSSRGKRMGFLSAIAIGASGDRMPPPAYRFMHGESRLSAADRNLLAGWANRERSRLVASAKLAGSK